MPTPSIRLPDMIQKDVAQTLSLSVRDEDGSEMTITAGTFELLQGGTVIVAETACDTLGSPATFNLDALDTAAASYGSDCLELWRLTVDSVPYVFRRTAYMVRYALYPVITDDDLRDAHEDIQRLRPSGISTYAMYRDRAWEILNRDLIRKGKRVDLILDSWELGEAHLCKSLELIFIDFSLELGDGRYKQLADYYAGKYMAEMESMAFRYDRDEGGDVDTGDREAASPILMLGRPPTMTPWPGGRR